MEYIIDKFYIDPYVLNDINNRDWEKIPFDTNVYRVLDKDSAQLIIFKIFSLDDLKNMSNYFLLENDITKYYLGLIRINLDQNLELLSLPIFEMKNVFFFTFDLRDHVLMDNNIKPLRGVTIPTLYKFSRTNEVEFDNIRKYFFSFKGNCNKNGWYDCSNVRKKLKYLTRNTKTYYSFLYEDTSEHGVNTCKKIYEDILLNSVYSIVSHGNGRWSHRLVESMGAGAIPVIISDGLTLPFEQIIDYSNACIIIKENDLYNLNDIHSFTDFLPKDKDTINKLQLNAYEIYNKFFKNNMLICDMLLLSAKIEKQNSEV
jgi:hypothetical protein